MVLEVVELMRRNRFVFNIVVVMVVVVVVIIMIIMIIIIIIEGIILIS